MKIRSRTESRGSSMSGSFHLVEGAGCEMAEPDGDEARPNGADGVGAGAKPLALAGEGERLEAERRKRGVAAAEAGHEKLPRVAAGEHPAAGLGQREEKSDKKRARHIDEQRAPRERRAEVSGYDAVQPETRHAAERAAKCDESIEPHEMRMTACRGIRLGQESSATQARGRFSLAERRNPSPAGKERAEREFGKPRECVLEKTNRSGKVAGT